MPILHAKLSSIVADLVPVALHASIAGTIRAQGAETAERPLALVAAAIPADHLAEALDRTPALNLPLLARAIPEPDPDAGEWSHAWLPSRVSAFERVADRLADACRRLAVELWWRPTHADVLSDVPSIASFFRKREGAPFALVLDPMALLAPSMRANAAEHLERVLDALGRHPALRLVVVAPDDEGTTSDRDRSKRTLLRRMIDERVDERVPRLIVDEDGWDRRADKPDHD